MKKLFRFVILLALPPFAFAGPKLAKDLPPGSSNASVDVIVQFHTPPTNDDLKQLGTFGQVKKTFGSIKAVNASVPSNLLAALENNPNVRYISPNRSHRGFLDLTTAAVGASVAWQYGWDGTGVGVAIIDSGIAQKVDDLTGSNGLTRVVYSESFVAGLNALDDYGHGTHVAGIVGGNGKDSSGSAYSRTLKGVAPNVNLINLRVLDQNGGGREADVISAIQRAIDLKNTYNIRVINLSLGRPVFESYTLDPLCQAVESAWKAGIVVVVAAGNYGRDNSMLTQGYGTIAAPGNDPYVITVGAMNTNGTSWTADDKIASYSSKGPTLIDHIVKPDLVAPGNRVVSVLAPKTTLSLTYPQTVLIPSAYYQLIGAKGNSTNYFRLSGTSMATPVVSAAAALLIQQHPSLTPDQVKARLMKTAVKALNLYSTATDASTLQSFNSESDIFTVGAGSLNIAAALSSYDLALLPALSPQAVYDPVAQKTGIIRNFSVSWGDSVLWGDSAVFGTFVFSRLAVSATDDSVLWGDSVCWGDSTSTGFSVLWGTSVNSTSTPSALAADGSDL